MDPRNLIAIDPSLTCSGWALFGIASGTLLGVGKIKPPGPDTSLPSRLESLQRAVSELLDQLDLDRRDLMVCEAPTTMRDPKAALKVEQVRSIFESVARQREVRVPGRLNPRTVQYELMGLRGKQLARNIIKKTAIKIIEGTFKGPLERLNFEVTERNLARNQDIVDAILVGQLAVHRVKTGSVGALDLDSLFEERTNRAFRRWQPTS